MSTASNRGSVHGEIANSYSRGCRCLSCRRGESVRVRAAYESSCVVCGGPCWGRYSPGRRCRECVHVAANRPLQPQGLRYQWGCP